MSFVYHMMFIDMESAQYHKTVQKNQKYVVLK